MASFTAFLEVSGRRYPLYRYELSMHQETDTLGRPASPVLGGTISCSLSSPGSADPFLYQWMMSPTMQHDGKVRLLQAEVKATEKTISFFNAYCTHMDLSFVPGRQGGSSASGAGSSGMPSSLIQLQISPQRIAVGAILHDNNWPLDSHGAGESFTKQSTTPSQEPGVVSDIAHTVLDVAGLIPVIGEVADGANALYYLAEGNKTDAALSAAAMIPVAGWAATGGKVLRKGAKALKKGRALKKAKAVQAAAKGAANKVPLPSKLATQWQGQGDYPGVDKFRDMTVKKGKVIYAGEPGASGFFFTEKSLKKVGGSADNLWQGLQVKKHPKFGYRKKVGIYEATEDIPGAFGTVKANPDHGPGGLQQIYLPDMSKMKKIGEIDLN